MPTVKLEIGLRCRTLLGSGVPRLHINGFNLLGFCMQRFGRLGGGGDWGIGGLRGQWKTKEENLSVLYIRHTQPRGFFPQFVSFSIYLLFLFKL